MDGSDGDWGGTVMTSYWSVGSSNDSSMSITSSVDCWGVLYFVCVDDTGWAGNPLDDWFASYWGWDMYVVWGINMDGGWYFDSLDYVLNDIIWDIVWSLNWDWFVDNEGFFADTDDWGIVSNSSQKDSWDGNVEVSKDWFENGGVVSSNVWAGSVFYLLGYYWLRYVDRQSIWSSNVVGGVWSWDVDDGGVSNVWSGSGTGNWGNS